MIPIIDSELRGLIPPLLPEERALLEHNILKARKCHDAIILWGELIVDGHNRFEICMEHGVPFEVKEVEFASREAAKVWILENQLGRRNLNEAARIEIVLLKEEILRERAKKKQSDAGKARKVGGKLLSKKTSHPDENIYVQKALAAEAGVSEGTLYSYKQIKDSNDPHLLKQVQEGKLKIGTAHRMLEKELFKQLTSVDKMLKFIAENAHKDTSGQIYKELEGLSSLQQMLVAKLDERRKHA